MIHSITPVQYQQYWQQWLRPVADGDTEGQQQKLNAAFWVAYCLHIGQEGAGRDPAQAQRILEQVIQEQDSIAEGDNHHDNTGKHRGLLAWLVDDGARSSQLSRQAVSRLEIEVQAGGNDENYPQAAYYLGDCLFFGDGVDKDCWQGIRWLKIAAELGHEGAQRTIGINCFQVPFGAEIVSWLQQIADQNNNAWAQFELGWCHEKGDGVKKDLVKAVEWYNKAIAQGYATATRFKQDLLNELSPEECSKILGCVARNQKIEKAKRFVQQSVVGGAPLSLWSYTLAFFQNQEHPPWEAPSPTFLSLKDAIMPQLRD